MIIPDTEDFIGRLVGLYNCWIRENNLPNLDAEEMLHEHLTGRLELTDRQLAFLEHFNGMWQKEV